jgi:O-antigen/teichoic acid export membrane protein
MNFRLKINLLASWGDHAIGLLIGLFLMPFVLNTAGDEQYGLWLFICSIAGYSGLMNLGFGETISRFVAHHHEKNDLVRLNRVVNVVGAIYLGMTTLVLVIAGVVAWLAPTFYDSGIISTAELRTVILLLGANVAVSLLGSVFGGVITGLQRFDLERGIRSASGIVRLVLTVVLLQKEHALSTLALVFLISTLAENVGYLAIVFKQLPGLKISWRFLNRETLRECLGFSMFSLLDSLSERLIDATDTIIIGAVFGTKYIVPYYVAQRLTTFIVLPMRQIGAVVMPRGAQLEAGQHDSRVRTLVQKAAGFSLLLAGAFFIGAWFFGDSVLQAWIGRDFGESHMILLVLLGSQIIATPLDVLRRVLFGMGKVGVPSLLYFAEAVANLVLTLLLIPHFGLLGVALGTAIPVATIELFVLLPYALKQLEFQPSAFLRRVVTPQLLPLAALLGYSLVVWLNFQIDAAWLPVIAVSAGGGVVLGAAWGASHYASKRLNIA